MLEALWLVGLASAYQFAYQRARAVVVGKECIHRDRWVSTGRSSLRYTSSVTRVLAWPTRWAMSSIGTPELDNSETKLCRSSRRPGLGVHPSRGNDAPKGSADVGGIKWAAGGRREHEIVLLKLVSAFGTLLLDQIPVLREGFDAAGRQLECAA